MDWSNISTVSPNTTNTTHGNPPFACTTHYCIPMALAISLVSVCGLCSNGVVIWVISSQKKLHRPTFVAISALCVCDFLFLLFRYIRYVISAYFREEINAADYRTVKLVCDFGGLASGGASIVHVVLLSILRYFIVVHPLKSHVSITNKRIMLASLAVWVIMSGYGGFYLYAVVINYKNDQQLAEVTNNVITVVMSVLPITIIAVFHILKANKLKSSIVACKKNTTKQMSKVITFVIVCFIVTSTPANVKDILVISYGHRKDMWIIIFGHVARIFLFINYAINPFIYYLHSPMFKKSVKCNACKMRHKPHKTNTFSSSRDSVILKSYSQNLTTESFVKSDSEDGNEH